MTLARIPPPRGQEKLMTGRRITTLVASFVVALCSGTNYVFSAYAPQLGEHLNITHTQLNLIAVAGNIGVYSSGPILGHIVDARGPSHALLCAAALLLMGYTGIWNMYERGLPSASDTDRIPRETLTLSTFAFDILVLFSFLSGVGGDAGLICAVNTTAKSFPDWARATPTGLVISGFGLSAFLFSTLAHALFAGDTARFLLLLALGTSVPVLAGFWLVKVVPVGEDEGVLEEVGLGHGRRRARDDQPIAASSSASALDAFNDPDAETHVRLLEHDHLHVLEAKDDELPEDSGAILLTPFRDQSFAFSDDIPAEGGRKSLHAQEDDHNLGLDLDLDLVDDYNMEVHMEEEKPNVYGSALWRSPDFWLLFSVLSLVSGTGLMYINNVGSISQALFLAKTHSPSSNSSVSAVPRATYDNAQATRWQAAQVSWISVMNCAGRIGIGLLSDLLLSHPPHLPRSHALILVSALALVSQLAAAFWVSDVEHLWIVSALLGTAYGSAFSLAPTVCLEWFGLAHFSENWGYLALSPMVAGNLFSLVFGRNLDAHSSIAPIPSIPGNSSLPVTTISSTSTPLPTSTSTSLPTSTSHHPTVTSPALSLPPARTCLQGRACYVSSIYLTIAASILAIALSIWASVRDRRKIEDNARRRRKGRGMVLGTPRTGRGEIALGSAGTTTSGTGRGEIALGSGSVLGSARGGGGWDVGIGQGRPGGG